MRRRLSLLLPCALAAAAVQAAPLPIDPLWKSESFRKTVTGSFGIDSRIEPIITTDEEFYLKKSAEEMAASDRKAAIATLGGSSILDRSPAMLFNLATLQYEEDDKAAAQANFTKALERFPNFRDAHRNLAVLLVQDGKFNEAETHLTRAIELGASDGVTMGLLGYCHASRDHHQAALDCYRFAMITQPKERQWKLGAAQALIALEQHREAADILQTLIEALPEDIGPWLAQTDAWIQSDDKPRAAANLEVAHRAGALDANSILSLGHLYQQSELPDLALERYRAALTAPAPVAAPRAVEALELILSASDWARGKEIAALFDGSEFYRQAFDPATGDDKKLISRLTRARAVLELETGDAAEGAKRVEEWLRQEPLDGPALILLARFREEAGEAAEAEMLLEQAARVPESAATAHLAHGRLLVTARDYEKAIEHFEKSQELNPTDALAEYIAAIRELSDAR